MGLHEVIERGNINFILTPGRIYVETTSSTFYLEPQHSYWTKHWRFVGSMIKLGEVYDLSTLALHCGNKVKWVTVQQLRDVVYPVKKIGENDELRYSLRSLSNLPHRKVYIVGHKPDWCTNVVHLQPSKYDYKWVKASNRHHDTEMKWLAAITDPGLSQEFYAMNDDFFVMRKCHALLNYHKGGLHEHIAGRNAAIGGEYTRALRDTEAFLQRERIDNPLSYELHIPALMDKTKRLIVHNYFLQEVKYGRTLLPRSTYGNMFYHTNSYTEDVKNSEDKKLGFLSTNEGTFEGEIGDYIRSKFTEASPYEL